MLRSLTPRRMTVAAAGVALLVTGTLAPPAGAETRSVRESHRPPSADAAEQWWISCTTGLPSGADAAERWAADCW